MDFQGIKSDTIGQYGVPGFKTDKICSNSKDIKTFAIGCNKSALAYIVIKEFPKGNYIINASSMFSKGLSNDDDIQLLMMNLLSHG